MNFSTLRHLLQLLITGNLPNVNVIGLECDISNQIRLIFISSDRNFILF